METFYHPVSLGVVSCRTVARRTKEIHQRSPKVGFELLTLIRCYGRGDAKARNPTVEQSGGARLCRGVSHWDCLGPSCIPIYACEQICVALRRRQRADDINVNVREARVWLFKSLHVGFNMSMNLRLLANVTHASPVSNISFHIGPDVAAANQMTRRFNSWV